MGIKNLNRFLLNNCTKLAIHKIHLEELKNKTVVVDTSIYMYKFIAENALLENTYLLISLFKKYDINAIFIFDGKPPAEKHELIKDRQQKKQVAEHQYKELQAALTIATDDDAAKKREIELEMNVLKKQFIRVKDREINSVKQLMDAYCVEYHTSNGEADELCAAFVKTSKAWACITDDMDMFIYDCPYIIRSVSLLNHTAHIYDKQTILKELEMTPKQFQEIIILSGTDYNIHSKTSLNETIKWFYEYKKYVLNTASHNNQKPMLEFYVWLIKNTKYINDFSELLRTYRMFMTNNAQIENITSQCMIVKNTKYEMHLDKMKSIMGLVGFIFV